MFRSIPAILLLSIVPPVATAADVVFPKSKYDNGYYGKATSGDFVLYVDPDGYPTFQVQVYRIDGFERAVTVTRTVWPKPVGSGQLTTTERRVFTGPEPAGREDLVVTSESDKIQLMNKEWNCTRYEYRYKNGPKKGQLYERAWFSPAAPFEGLLKAETPTGNYQLSEYLYQKNR